MRIAFFISSFIALAFLGLIVLNLYDFWYRPELPWREGDLRWVMITHASGVLLFGIASLIFQRLSKASR